MLVSVNKSAMDWFRRKARENPNEILAFMLGRKESRKKICVSKFVYPKLKISTPREVQEECGEWDRISAQYAKSGLHIVGDIHTHPDAPPVMSEADFDSHAFLGNLISGIVSVNDRKTWVSFWQLNSALPCEWQYSVN